MGLSLKLIFISLPKKRVVFTVGWGKKVLVTFNASKTQPCRSNNCGSADVEMDGSVLEEKSASEMLGLTFTSK